MPSRTSDEAVKTATGKDWKEWFTILDKAGAKKMEHRDIADFVFEKHLKARKSGGWWSQMVTVEYERERGLRAVNETKEGFSVSIHRTFSGSVEDLMEKWERIATSRDVKVRKLVPVPSKTKHLRLRYRADVGEIFAQFDERPSGKARIMIEAVKLPAKSYVEPMREFWKGILDQLSD